MFYEKKIQSNLSYQEAICVLASFIDVMHTLPKRCCYIEQAGNMTYQKLDRIR